MASDRDKSIIRCAGCDAVVYAQSHTMESGIVYYERHGNLWHCECLEIHKEALKDLGLDRRTA
jgi:hypothetical protein